MIYWVSGSECWWIVFFKWYTSPYCTTPGKKCWSRAWCS